MTTTPRPPMSTPLQTTPPPPQVPPSLALLNADDEITVLAARRASYADALAAAETAGAAARPRLQAAQADYDEALALMGHIRRKLTTGSQAVTMTTNPMGLPMQHVARVEDATLRHAEEEAETAYLAAREVLGRTLPTVTTLDMQVSRLRILLRDVEEQLGRLREKRERLAAEHATRGTPKTWLAGIRARVTATTRPHPSQTEGALRG